MRVAIKNKTNGLWWTGTGWGAFTYLSAALADPGATATAWTLEWTPPTDGEYALLVEARDAAANPDPSKPWISFSVYPGGTDAVEPDTTIAVPDKGGAYPDGPLAISGQATDDATGVAAVGVAIKDTQTGLWWTGSDWGSFTFNDAVVDAPGAAASDWTFDWAPPGPGSFGVLARATDVAGNIDSTKPWHGFTIYAGGADIDAPDATVTVPVKSATYPLAPLTMNGSATDPAGGSGIATVDIAIKNVDTGQWWTGSGWGAFSFLPASVDAPGADSTDWTFDWTPSAAGSYGIVVRATDGQGNIDPTKPWVGFTIE